jgi:hypothetical protein
MSIQSGLRKFQPRAFSSDPAPLARSRCHRAYRGRRRRAYADVVTAPRGAADDYWNRWLEAAALRPDLQRLAKTSIKAGGASEEAHPNEEASLGRAPAGNRG